MVQSDTGEIITYIYALIYLCLFLSHLVLHPCTLHLFYGIYLFISENVMMSWPAWQPTWEFPKPSLTLSSSVTKRSQTGESFCILLFPLVVCILSCMLKSLHLCAVTHTHKSALMHKILSTCVVNAFFDRSIVTRFHHKASILVICWCSSTILLPYLQQLSSL